MKILSGMPLAREFQNYPRLALVAFAARCARRVLPAYDRWYGGKNDYIANGVISSENLAAGGSIPSKLLYNLGFEIRQASEYAERRSLADDTERDELYASQASAAADTVADAVFASAHMLADVAAGATVFLPATIDGVINCGGDDKVLRDVLARSLRHDWLLLAEVVKRKAWGDKTPVPPEFFGPLWREGPPDGWPEDETTPDEPLAMKFQIAVPEGMDELQSREFNARVKGFLVSLSRLHAEMGGNGLQIAEHDSDAPVLAEDETPDETDTEAEDVPELIGGRA